MKILKSGIIPEYKFTCHICGCEFVAYRTECNITEMVKLPEAQIGVFVSVACPECHTELKQEVDLK